MDSTSPDRLLAGLTPAQRAAVTSEAGVLCVVAGAGSGKTTVLTRRVAWRVLSGTADAAHVQVVTFTRKAATELRSRLGRLGAGADISSATFHAAAFAQLRRHWADQGVTGPALLPDAERTVRRLAANELGVGPHQASTMWNELRWARARLVEPDDYPEAARRARRTPGVPLDQLAGMMQRYHDEKRRRRVIDLDDLVPLCTELLEAEGPAAAAVRWRVRHLFVDEFQDVNPAQWRLLEAWRNGRHDLCVVGDPRQAVYAWNGSDPTLMARLPTLVPETAVVRLEENHRSTPQIVEAASAVLGPAPAAGWVADPPVGARLAGSTASEPGPPPLLRGFEDEGAEAEAVARWVRTCGRPGDPWGRRAVLARTHARLSAVAEALARSGVPFRRPGPTGRPTPLTAVLGSLRSIDRRLPLRAGLVDALDATGPAGLAEAETAGPAPGDLLADLADEHAAEEQEPTVGSFLAWLAANQDGGGVLGLSGDGVHLLTFHQAKGLEWPAVAVIGLEEGTMPIAYASDPDALSEERRLLYVALTRAEDRLWCSWAARPLDAGTGTGTARGPSPYLAAVRATLGTTGAEDAPDPGRRLAELRHRLAAVG